jgi:hypothetical protein
VEKLRGSLGEQETIDSLLTMLAGGTDPEKVGWKFTPEEWDRKARPDQADFPPVRLPAWRRRPVQRHEARPRGGGR